MATTNDLQSEILSWNFSAALKAYQRNEQNFEDSSCEQLPDRFLNSREYINAFRRPCVLECKASALQIADNENSVSHCVTVQVSHEDAESNEPVSKAHRSETCNIVVRFVPNKHMKDWAAPTIPSDTLIAITLKKKLDSKSTDGVVLAVVQPGRVSGGLRMRIHTSKEAYFTDPAREYWLHSITSLVSSSREFEALLGISSIGLGEEILLGIANAGRENNRCKVLDSFASLCGLPEGLQQSLKTRLNQAQLEVIESLCDLSSNPKAKITLVRGPPGSGKTLTLVSILNAVHVQQYNRYYSAVADAIRTGKFINTNERSWLDLTKVAKPRIIVCAPSNVAIDNIILRLFSDKFTDGEGRQYVPRLVRIGKGSTNNLEVAESALSRLVEKLVSESGDDIRKKISQLESVYSEYRHGVVVQMAKLQCMAAGTPYLFKSGIETRVTTNPAGLLIPYWADHTTQTTSNVLPSPVKESEQSGISLDQMEEYVFYTKELMRYLELWEEAHWQLQRYRLVHSCLQTSSNSSFDRHLLQQSLETLFMNEASVVCGTLSSTGLSQVCESSPFQTCVVDEAAQAVELSTLIPLKLGVNQLVLVGDPQQLPATVICKRELLGGNYERSLFERLEKCGVPVHTLNQQYRMHPSISVFPRNVFYQGTLLDAPEVSLKSANTPPFFSRPPWNMNPFLFIDTASTAMEEVGGASKSRSNPEEAAVCVSLYCALVKIARETKELHAIGKANKVGVISPYAEQVRVLREMFTAAGVTAPDAVEIATVDSFQGKEKDVIILSTVRATPESNSVGFLADMRRMNVALTRAKIGMFVVGHAKTLRVNPTWSNLIDTAMNSKNAFVSVPPNTDDMYHLLHTKFFQ